MPPKPLPPHQLDQVVGGTGNDSFVWAPGDGNDEFHGGTGTDTLQLGTVSLDQLQSALQLERNTNLQMNVTGSALGLTVTFMDATGSPATVQGTLTFKGETLRFSEVKKIQLV